MEIRTERKLAVFFGIVCGVFGVAFVLGELFTPWVLSGSPSRFVEIAWTFIVRFSLGVSATALIMAIGSVYRGN